MAEAPPRVEQRRDVLKPELDRRVYKSVVLDNGLRVLLASDPSADAAAAAMSIRAGSFQDPPNFLGLAHFHEHMLFLGTEKFPDEDEYERYLKDHGGYSNAYTADELTNYFFRVNAPHLPGALDRFAQFFLAPSFELSAVDRELRAVDSESTNYAADETWRRMQVMKSFAAPEHPFHRFSVGNLETLGHAGAETLREELVRWNAAHYHAGAMRLAIFGRESLEDLEILAHEHFGSIRATLAEALNASPTAPSVSSSAPSVESAAADAPAVLPGGPPAVAEGPWAPNILGSLVEVVPKLEERTVGVFWPLPPGFKHLYAKVEHILSHILGHEGAGSLHALLNREGLIESLSAGPRFSFSDSQLLGIEVSLTLEGERRLSDVLDRIFAYVAVMCEAGPSSVLHAELQQLSEIDFRFREDSPAPDNLAAFATRSMQHYPTWDALRGPSAMDEFMPDVVQEWLNLLSPDRCVIVRASPNLSSMPTQDVADLPESESPEAASAQGTWFRERWYGAPFRRRKLTAAEVNRWANPDAHSRRGLQVPAANPFLPTDFTLRSSEIGIQTNERDLSALNVVPPSEVPQDSSMLRLWSKTDDTFRVPRSSFNAHIMTPVYTMGPVAVVALRLFCDLLNDDLNAYAYDAAAAGLHYDISFSDRFTFGVSGFSHRLPELLAVVCQRLRTLLDELSNSAKTTADFERRSYWADRLEKHRELLLREYDNFYDEDPTQVADYNIRHVLLADMWHLSEYKAVLRGHTGETFLRPLVEHMNLILANIRIEVLAHGNLVESEAESMAQVLREGIVRDADATPLPEHAIETHNVVLLPPAATKAVIFDFDLEPANPLEDNSATLNVYQVGPYGEDTHRDACLMMVSHLARTSAFTQLRTQEQLGYIVHAAYHQVYGVNGVLVLVQGPRLPPVVVDTRIEAWIAQFRQELEDMPDEDFDTNVQAVVDLKSERNKRLSQETSSHWQEIVQRTYRFDRLRSEVGALEAVQKSDVLAFFDEHIARGAPKRRKVSSRVRGAAARLEEQRQLEQEAVDIGDEDSVVLGTLADVRAFKHDLPSHGMG
eukprot:TRINITY_DN63228_c0_g1_i1.p1 TRINITY_DN63228_c0_g1~~TRINITY_DN63228_c0_g1_i1.p1  ORF type:complete len:1189 (-),score=221.31 TRINITY_DN63228_c0_g1_i1:30-3209(-)